MFIYGYIYGLKCKVNGKWYVGQTTDYYIQRYINHHYKVMKGGNRKKMNRAIEKYGWEAFEFVILDTFARDQEELNVLECFYIKYYDSIKNGYNIREGGSNGKMSPESCEKISIGVRKHNEEFGCGYVNMTREEKDARNKKLSEARMGVPTGNVWTDERKQVQSEAMMGNTFGLGRKNTPEQSQAQSERVMGDKNPMFGVPSSRKGIPRTPEVKAKLSAAHMGRPGREVGEEERQHLREIMTGVPKSPEAVQKRKDTLAAKTPEEREESTRKMKETKASRSPEEKAEINRKQQETKKKNREEKKLLEQQKLSVKPEE